MHRREFIFRSVASAAVFSLGARAAGLSRPDRLVGSQLYGWGQYYERAGKELGDHLDEVFSALRDAGYDYAEGTLDVGAPENNLRFAEKLKSKGLRPVSFYTGGRLHEQRAAAETVQRLLAAAKVAKEAGFSIINCNPDPIGRDKTEAELATQAKALQSLADGLQALGMQLGVHHHTPELRNGAKEFHYNFDHTKANVGFCYDVHWVFRGGVAPAEALAQYGRRVVSWHLRQSRAGIWWEDLKSGDIDYGAVARYADEQKLPHLYTVELALEAGTKVTRSVVENHRLSREFVRRVMGV